MTAAAEAPQYGILHLATHGIADAEDPLASLVALAAPVEDADELAQHARHLRAVGVHVEVALGVQARDQQQ